MLRRPLAIAVTLGLLFCGATVILEAVGLLFHTGVPDPQQRVEAFVAGLEADLSPVDLPTEPVEFPRELAQDPQGYDSQLATADEPAQAGDGASSSVEIVERAEPGERSDARLAGVFSGPIATQPEIPAHPDEGVTPGPAEAEEAGPVPAQLPAVHAASGAPAGAHPVVRVTAARRTNATLGATGYAAFGWPVLDWLIW
jgi:hypothetical protein